MIHDLHASRPESPEPYDVCIVGSGPAGMTVASELASSGLRLCVLESGRAKATRHGDGLRQVRSEGIEIKDYSRERVLGGASTTWSGLAGVLDAIDLSPRPFMRHSGWPLALDDLSPYYERAARDHGFAPLDLYAPGGFDAVKGEGDRELAWSDLREKTFLAASMPQDFGARGRPVFEAAGVDLFLDATVIELAPAGDGRRIARAVARTSRGEEISFEADVFVVAAGGIENARLLLDSRGLCPQGLGNERDQVGRYLMNHPKNPHGIIRLRRPLSELPYYFGCLRRGWAGYGGLRLAEERQREHRCLNSYVRFEPLYPWSGNRGVESFVFLVKRCRRLLALWKARARERLVSVRDYSETGDDSPLQNERKSLLDWLGLFGSILVNLPTVVRYVLARLRQGGPPPVHAIQLRNFMEMEPDPENRVLLSGERDANGRPRALVRHQTTALDRESLARLHDVLASELASSGLGELESDLRGADPWPIDYDASHHMGTTRMGTDPATSVTTPDGRLHTVDNVYLAGSSLFPTSGCANPTLTIVALSIRLADHLRAKPSGADEPGAT